MVIKGRFEIQFPMPMRINEIVALQQRADISKFFEWNEESEIYGSTKIADVKRGPAGPVYPSSYSRFLVGASITDAVFVKEFF